MEVKAVLLKNGHEFIAEEIENNKNTLKVKNPVVIMQDPAGQAKFAPWFGFAASREFEFRKDDVLLVEDAGAEVVSGYSQAFGLVQVPPEKKIIT